MDEKKEDEGEDEREDEREGKKRAVTEKSSTKLSFSSRSRHHGIKGAFEVKG